VISRPASLSAGRLGKYKAAFSKLLEIFMIHSMSCV
jgi:hypothetical protein